MKRLLTSAALSLALITAAPAVPFGPAGTAEAQQMLRIAAVVNDDVISIVDLINRIDFQLFSAGQESNDEIRRRLAPQVLRLMIDERLMLQETKRRGVVISDDEVAPTIAAMEQQNKVAKGSLLASLAARGIQATAFTDQIRAKTAWERMLAGKVRGTRPITEEEIDQHLAELRAAQGRPEHLLSDIFLSFDSAGGEPQARQLAETVLAELGRGATFAQLSQQFSNMAASSTGGDLGWVREGQLDSTLEAAAAALVPGQVSSPVRTLAGYHILFLRDRRVAAGADPNKSTLTLSRILLPLAANAAPVEVDSQISLGREILAASDSCAAFNDLAKPLGGGPIGVGTLAQLPAQLASAVSTVAKGKGAPPFRTSEGVNVLFVCDRTDDGTGLPSRADVRLKLLIQRVEAESRRSLRDLRQSANIEIRL